MIKSSPSPAGNENKALGGALLKVVFTTQAIPATCALMAALAAGFYEGPNRGSLVLALYGFTLGLTAFAIYRRTRHFRCSSRAFHHAAIALSWVLGCLTTALPIFLIAHLSGPGNPTLMAFQNPLNAFYEGVSSLSSCGLTVTADPTELPPAIQFLRSISQWVGGVGLAVFALFVISPSEQGSSLYSAETREWEVANRIRPTLVRIVIVYLILTGACCGLFLAFSMPPWEAVNHALIIASTGGLTITADSFTGYSDALQGIAALFMVLGALSFGCLFLLMTGSWRQLIRKTVPGSLLLWLALALALFLGFQAFGPAGPDKSGLFNLVSAISTCGASAGPITPWAAPLIGMLVIAMFVGGASDSTAGGLKIDRVVWITKIVKFHLRGSRSTEKTPTRPTWNSKPLNSAQFARRSRRTLSMATLFAITLGLGFFLLRLAYPGEVSSDRVLFQAASSLSAVGLSMDLGGPNRPDLAKATEIGLMLLGRLEINAFFFLPPVLRKALRSRTGTVGAETD